jgi:hypothetical protein
VQALYDFAGEPGSAELSITAGEFLTVTRQDVGDGWWEGVNQTGQAGLFPAAYVEVRVWIHCSDTQPSELKLVSSMLRRGAPLVLGLMYKPKWVMVNCHVSDVVEAVKK